MSALVGTSIGIGLVGKDTMGNVLVVPQLRIAISTSGEAPAWCLELLTNERKALDIADRIKRLAYSIRDRAVTPDGEVVVKVTKR
jgi:hypothetical protein